MKNNILALPHFEMRHPDLMFLGQAKVRKFQETDLNNPEFMQNELIKEGALIVRRKIEAGTVNGKRLLVFEPHPDDAALSCAGLMLEYISKGFGVTVLNIFSRSSVSTFPWGSTVQIDETEYESLRLVESRMAIQDYLGQEFDSLCLPSSLKRGHTRIFEPYLPIDRRIEDPVYKAVAKMVSHYDFQALAAPLAVGGHTDHQVVHNVASRCAFEGLTDEMWFYEDMPYSRKRQDLETRLDRVRESFNRQGLNLKSQHISLDGRLDIIADLISIYRSQFDDVNREQMLELVTKDSLLILDESRKHGTDCGFLAQRYWKVETGK